MKSTIPDPLRRRQTASNLIRTGWTQFHQDCFGKTVSTERVSRKKFSYRRTYFRFFLICGLLFLQKLSKCAPKCNEIVLFQLLNESWGKTFRFFLKRRKKIYESVKLKMQISVFFYPFGKSHLCTPSSSSVKKKTNLVKEILLLELIVLWCPHTEKAQIVFNFFAIETQFPSKTQF